MKSKLANPKWCDFFTNELPIMELKALQHTKCPFFPRSVYSLHLLFFESPRDLKLKVKAPIGISG